MSRFWFVEMQPNAALPSYHKGARNSKGGANRKEDGLGQRWIMDAL